MDKLNDDDDDDDDNDDDDYDDLRRDLRYSVFNQSLLADDNA